MSSNVFTLYCTPYSIRSTMVRTMLAMKDAPRDGRPDMIIHYKVVNISNDNPEQLNEHFLSKVNPKGKVPVLVNDTLLSEPMPETVDISYYICDWYPKLLPPKHETVIKELVAELHKINFTILSFGPESKNQAKLAEQAQKLLSQPNVSEEYAEALSNKASDLNQAQSSFTPGGLLENETRVRDLCLKVANFMQYNGREGTGLSYIFGACPTVLDAHILPFLCRIADVKRSNLIQPQVLEWVERFKESDMWRELVPSGTTLPPGPS
ncbi:hypothetical protein SCUP234_05875 [Seiridium cupressi]